MVKIHHRRIRVPACLPACLTLELGSLMTPSLMNPPNSAKNVAYRAASVLLSVSKCLTILRVRAAEGSDTAQHSTAQYSTAQ